MLENVKGSLNQRIELKDNEINEIPPAVYMYIFERYIDRWLAHRLIYGSDVWRSVASVPARPHFSGWPRTLARRVVKVVGRERKKERIRGVPKAVEIALGFFASPEERWLGDGHSVGESLCA